MVDIYTDIAFFMKWINETVMNIGGMMACDRTLESTPVKGLYVKHLCMLRIELICVSSYHCYPDIICSELGPTAEALPMTEDTVVLLTGGSVYQGGQWSALASSEVYPSTGSCSPVPLLPEPRAYHALFTTGGPISRVAACGGWSLNGDFIASCLALDPLSQLWDENEIGPLPNPRGYHTAISLGNIGTYMIGGLGGPNSGRTTDFLALGNRQWVNGPTIPCDMAKGPCSVAITDISFLVIGGEKIREYQVDTNNPTSESGWQDESKWPNLQTIRNYWFGCSLTNATVIVAGGGGDEDGAFYTTEVVNLETRKRTFAEHLSSPRRGFHIMTIVRDGSESVLGLAGWNGFGVHYSSVEEFDPFSLTWNTMQNSLLARRSFYGAVVVPKTLICGEQ